MRVEDSRESVFSHGGNTDKTRIFSPIAFIPVPSVAKNSCLLDLAPGELSSQIGVDEDVEPAVENGVGVADLHLGPEVLAPLVGLEDVIADLAAEADLGFLVVSLGVFGLTLLFLEPDQLGLEQLQRQVVVLVLRPLGPRLGGDSGRDVRVAHARFGLVLVLAAWTAAPEDVALQLVVLQLDVDRVVDLRHHLDRRKRRLPLVRRAERADPDQAMDPGLASEIAVDVFPLDVNSDRLDTSHFAIFAVNDLGLIAMGLGPHQVHPHEHLGPVARLGPARARMDGDIAVAMVVRPAEHRPQLELEEVGLGLLRRLAHLEVEIVAAVLLGQLDQGGEVVRLAHQGFERLDHAVERLQFQDDDLGLLLVVPEAWPLHHRGEFVASLDLVAQVKESLVNGQCDQ